MLVLPTDSFQLSGTVYSRHTQGMCEAPAPVHVDHEATRSTRPALRSAQVHIVSAVNSRRSSLSTCRLIWTVHWRRAILLLQLNLCCCHYCCLHIAALCHVHPAVLSFGECSKACRICCDILRQQV
jgi:hypothetical protein